MISMMMMIMIMISMIMLTLQMMMINFNDCKTVMAKLFSDTPQRIKMLQKGAGISKKSRFKCVWKVCIGTEGKAEDFM